MRYTSPAPLQLEKVRHSKMHMDTQHSVRIHGMGLTNVKSLIISRLTDAWVDSNRKTERIADLEVVNMQ